MQINTKHNHFRSAKNGFYFLTKKLIEAMGKESFTLTIV